MFFRAFLLSAALLCAAVPSAFATEPPPGADWSQAYFDSQDGGARLHADILRPKGLPADAKTPVILSIGPYFNHSGQTGVLGPVEDVPFDPVSGGPSDRFYDFINGAKVFEKGYTWVQVDLRGFGGSSGCLDWGGPGEQSDVVSAVEWAASQPWSTGKVGMYGKSYDGVTGLVGLLREPRGLAAVIAQEPVYDLYRYLYMNRVRFVNSLATPNLYNAIAGTPGTASDELAYNFESLNDTSRPGCPLQNFADQQDPNHNSPYWKQRDLIAPAKGKKTPLFLTQGFIENNTKPDGAFDFWNNVAGPKRAWFGQWEHVRGNDADENGRLRMGRKGWFDESMRFFDRYVAGKSSAEAPTEKDPPIALESSDGKWRSEPNWPPLDAFPATAKLKGGTYVDDATNNGTNDTFPPGPTGVGVWTFSPAFESNATFAGVPRLIADVATQAPDANFTAGVYDVDAQNNATLISRGTYLVPGSGGRIAFDLYGNDWQLPAGHRLGVLISSSHSEWWAHAPTGQTVTVKSASITVPYRSCARPDLIQGDPSIFLENYKENAPFAVDAETVNAGTDNGFPMPEPQHECTAEELAGGPVKVPFAQGGGDGGTQGTPAGCVDTRKFAFRIHQPRRSRIVKAVAYVNGKRKAVAKSKRGKAVRKISVARLPKNRVFTLKIVATAKDGRQTISVRKYRGCKKSRPRTSTRGPRRR
jgi:uncharacterized protein